MYTWHQIHLTIAARNKAADWYEKITSAKRCKSTHRSENLKYGSNLIQIQSKAIAEKSCKARIESIGFTVTDLQKALSRWLKTDCTVIYQTIDAALIVDPWGIVFELVNGDSFGQTHVNIASENPEFLLNWYEINLEGKRCCFENDSSRIGLKYDTMKVFFKRYNIETKQLPWGPIDHIGWLTDNIEKSYDQLVKVNTKFIIPPKKYGPAILAFVVDPYGIIFELIEFIDKSFFLNKLH